MWVNQHVVLLMNLANGFQPILVGALATAKTITISQLTAQRTKVKIPLGIQRAPESVDLPGIAIDKIIHKTLKVRGLRSEEHTSELQSRGHLVCRLLLATKKKH